MSDLGAPLNDTLAAECPPAAAALSPLGRAAYYPREIPYQSAQAKNAAYNGTIGQITDGHGSALPLPAIAAALSGLDPRDRSAALLYSPIEGMPEVRRRWRDWQRRKLTDGPPSSLPIVTAGLSQAVALVADLFGGPGRAVALPQPYWGNYQHMFGLRSGARVLPADFYAGGAFNPWAVEQALANESPGEAAVAVLNFPHNPGGYSPTVDERAAVRASLLREADKRPLVVLCDDAYLGLVYEPDIPTDSIFWELSGAHPNLLAVKADGATKEFAFFGGRVGFLTFGLPAESPAAAALEDKVKGLIRATIGSPSSLGQIVLLTALRVPDIEVQIEAVRLEMAHRYRIMRAAFAAADPSLIRPLPFNAGCFALLELDEHGPLAEEVRLHILAEEDTGVVAIPPRYIRLAFCSVQADEIPELVRRVEHGIRAMKGQAVAAIA